ncbi:NAD(P)H-binding protein [Streptomyces sp. NPDC000594]|uniref:NAD(P)-dependent oxidoreductase n=1 Tax=Streptomyces sp. NPDC000594 TaxID=3154261 RepID=UPI00332B51C8
MRLTVFGSTGGVGRQIVRQALAAGHEVTAVVRGPAGPAPGVLPDDARLTVFPADLTRPESLREAVAGRDAVLSGLGARKAADATAGLVARLTASVLTAMEAEGTRRLLVVSATPLGAPPPGEPLVDRVSAALVSRVFRRFYEDLEVMERELAAGSAEWTSVRPPRLLDTPLTGVYRTAVGGNPRSARTISRADVAHAMLALIDDPAAVRRPVGVAY